LNSSKVYACSFGIARLALVRFNKTTLSVVFFGMTRILIPSLDLKFFSRDTNESEDINLGFKGFGLEQMIGANR
jgi:hypothetical protein